jgi:alkylation response protein AidB-like acyl-CoA dehydrogenase
MSDSRMNPTPPVLAETVDEFRAWARVWLAEHMPCIDSGGGPLFNRDSEAAWQRARELQRRLSDGGFAGICFPREYGGLGLDYAFRERVLNFPHEHAADREVPFKQVRRNQPR